MSLRNYIVAFKGGFQEGMTEVARATLRINLLPFLSYELSLDELANSKKVDERIARLADIKQELQSAIDAVERLQRDADANKREVAELESTISQLRQDKKTAESLLQVPQESAIRLITAANTRGRLRGWVEGAILGLLTGFASGMLVWWLTAK